MYWLSKVLLGIVVVASIAAVFLTSMLFDVRGGWLKQVEDRQAKLEKLEENLRQKRLTVSDLENEVNRRMMPWGRAWEIAPQRIQLINPDEGIVQIDIGSNVGLAFRELLRGRDLLPTIDFFGQNADGTSSYWGTFRITAVEGDRASAQLIRRPYPGEVAQWQATAGAGVRIWEAVPSNWRALHSELQAQTAEAMQDVLDQQARLKTQDSLVAEAEKQLQRRMAELNGDADPVEGANQDTLDGLVVALRKEESVRNEQLSVLDRLRHDFDAKYHELARLLEQNRDLAIQLPQPALSGVPSRPAVGGTQESVRLR